MTAKNWKIGELITTADKWKNIPKSGMHDHIESAAKWAEKISDVELRTKVFERLTDAAGRHLGDTSLASDYLKKWITAAKMIPNDDKKLFAFHDITQVVGGLNDREHGSVFLEEIASEMRRFNTATFRGYGFRSLTNAAGQIGAKELVGAYWNEARHAADLATTDRNDIYWRPILPEAAFLLMENDRLSSTYFSESLSYVKTISYGFKRACYLGDLAKTAVLAFDQTKAIYHLNQFRNESFDSSDDSAKQTLIAGLAEAAVELSNKEHALTFLNKLQGDTEVIQDEWFRSLAYQALAEAAHHLGDNRLSSEYFTLASEAALQEKAPVTRVWHVSAFLLSKAKELGVDMISVGLLPKLEAAVAEVEASKTGDNQGLMMFGIYLNLTKVAVQLGAHEKGIYYLSQTKSLLSSRMVPKARHGDILALAKTARDLRELSQARELAQLAFDMAKMEINGVKDLKMSEGMQTVAGVAKLLTNMGEIRYACSLAETEGFSQDFKAAITGMVLAEYAENHYPKTKE